MSGPQSTVRVLVSYTQEAAAHRDRCRELADRLRDDGIEAWIDQYVPAPPEGWPRWMQQQITASTFVILVCTPTFCRRFEGTETPGVGHGATWEGLIATQVLYDNGARNEKLVPVLFDDATPEAVPRVLRPFTRHVLWADYDGLYRHLTAQPAIVPRPVDITITEVKPDGDRDLREFVRDARGLRHVHAMNRLVARRRRRSHIPALIDSYFAPRKSRDAASR